MRLIRRKQTDDVTGKLDNWFERFISHRLRLTPDEPQDPDFYALRGNEKGYLYRENARGGASRLVVGSHGSEKKGGYMVETRWAARHPLHLLSFVTHRGEWRLVTFAEPTATPPERLNLSTRRNKTKGHRPAHRAPRGR